MEFVTNQFLRVSAYVLEMELFFTNNSHYSLAPIFSILHSLLIFPLVFRTHTLIPTIRVRCNCGKILQINHPPFVFLVLSLYLSLVLFGVPLRWKTFPDKKIYHTQLMLAHTST